MKILTIIYLSVAHIIVLGSIIFMGYLIFIIVARDKSTFQKLMKVISISTGALIFLGSQTAGLSMPEAILRGIDPSGGLLVGALLFIAPGLLGSSATMLVYWSVDKRNLRDERYTYLVIMICTFIILMFSDNYLNTLSSNQAGERFILNISFLVGMALTLLFNFDITEILRSTLSGSDSNATRFLRGKKAGKHKHDAAHSQSRRSKSDWRDQLKDDKID